MNVQNMISSKGNRIANQFLISEEGRGALGNFRLRETFRSYNVVIAIRIYWDDHVEIVLDEKYWNNSVTTGKYRNDFLGEGIAETRKKIETGVYKLSKLN